MWTQNYNPLDSHALSTAAAAAPVAVVLLMLGLVKAKVHWAALMGMFCAVVVAVIVYAMPGELALRAALLGGAVGLLPAGWIVLNMVFLYQLAEKKGSFEVLREGIAGLTQDRRLQLLLVAFAAGAFFEGAGGYGTPIAVACALLVGLGFAPLEASGLALIANTAAAAFGALGTPVVSLAAASGQDVATVSAMIGRQLPLFSLLVPMTMMIAFCGPRAALGVWPAILVAGVSFAVPQFLVSNLQGPWLVDIVASICATAALVVLLLLWRPRVIWTSVSGRVNGGPPYQPMRRHSRWTVVRAWLPWLILALVVFAWEVPAWKRILDEASMPVYAWPGLDQLVQKVPPAVAAPRREPAVYVLNWLSATGSAILVAALLSGLVLGYRILELVRAYIETVWIVRHFLVTIVVVFATNTLMRFAGIDATLGLAFAGAGAAYPFLGTLLGVLGVALTGSATASNIVYGGLQKSAATHLALGPALMASAHGAGASVGRLVDAHSLAVASTASKWYGHEGDILRFVAIQAVLLACLMGLLVSAQAYLWPFTLLQLP